MMYVRFASSRSSMGRTRAPGLSACCLKACWMLRIASAPSFRYNTGPSSHPNYGPVLTRNAYIHPAFTPSGALITADFSKFHPHHRVFFLAYAKTQVGTRHPDLWNIQSCTGKIEFDHLERPVTGPVTARFVTQATLNPSGTDQETLVLGRTSTTPVRCHRGRQDRVDALIIKAELNALCRSVKGETHFGSDLWRAQTAQRLGLVSSLRARRQPSRHPANPEVNR